MTNLSRHSSQKRYFSILIAIVDMCECVLSDEEYPPITDKMQLTFIGRLGRFYGSLISDGEI